VKVAHKYAEGAKVAVRHVRRDGMDTLKKMEKDSDISQDESKHQADQIQELTDRMIKAIDELLATKEDEITQV
jgi:ribosome recycling factor